MDFFYSKRHSVQVPNLPSYSLKAIGLLVFLLAVLAPVNLSAQQLTQTALEVHVQHSPHVVMALGRPHVVYEIRLSNWGADSLEINQLNVFAGDDTAEVLSDLNAEEIGRRLRILGRAPSSGKPNHVLFPGETGFLYQWVTLSGGSSIPNGLTHEFHLVSAGKGEVMRSRSVSVASSAPQAVQPPVGSGNWVAVRAPSNRSGHRRAMVVFNGEPHSAERFAVDWVKLGADGHLFAGNASELTNWFSYEQPVLAIASGRVALVRDGLPDGVPLSKEVSAAKYTMETVTGNTVVLALDDGNFAVYAHLREGSISVKEGERVEEGYMLGQIGNSGHSLAPHLHFHIQDQPYPLKGEGQPFSLSSFVLIGKLDSIPSALRGAPWTAHPGRPPRNVTGEIPLENMVIEID